MLELPSARGPTDLHFLRCINFGKAQEVLKELSDKHWRQYVGAFQGYHVHLVRRDSALSEHPKGA